ncbi:response regulator transcription factor [Bacteroides heparinolyticus]|uniref:response regulator transcription factor n=1 Tax=Prevotella heparinolytica TaxID=28113 RepID=UPI0023EF91E0|nr:LuxR C-terminal-related transcriptional regulator [Bacteroides heparinolyticus]
MTPEIAIVDPNILSCLGLRTLLEEIIPTAVIRSFRSFGELMDDTPDMYVHYFISSQIYFEHTAFFLERKPRTIVLVNGEAGPQLPGMPTLNIYQDEKNLVKSILQLRQYGHQCKYQGKPAPAGQPDAVPNTAGDEHELSAREIEVLVLVVKGLINKEIADKLNISQTTVISHRKNITEKLGIKSVSGLTIYAVMHGYIEVDRI